MTRPAWIAAAVAAVVVTSAVAGSASVTIAVQSSILRWGQQATLTGTISSPKAEERS